MSLAKADTQQHTITIQLTNGATWVIDDDLNKVFLSSATHYSELNLNTALLQWAGNNQTKANQMRARIHAMASTPIRDNKLVKGAPPQGLIMGMPGNQSWNCYYSYYYCDVSSQPDFGGSWGTYSFGFYGESGAPIVDHDDFVYWQHFRDLACDAQTSGARAMVVGTPTAIGACTFFETGVGAAICGAALFAIVDGYDDYTKNAQMCESPYPGKNNW